MQKSLPAGINSELLHHSDFDISEQMLHFILELPNYDTTKKPACWVGITGSWRLTNRQIESDVRTSVRILLKKGYGIVSGGALGVDYFATDEVLKSKRKGCLRVFLPTPLDVYFQHYRNKAHEGVISPKQARSLISQLNQVKALNPHSLVTLKANLVNQESYYERNTRVVEASDLILGYRVNESKGTTDTLVKAHRANKKTCVNDYAIDVSLANLTISRFGKG